MRRNFDQLSVRYLYLVYSIQAMPTGDRQRYLAAVYAFTTSLRQSYEPSSSDRHLPLAQAAANGLVPALTHNCSLNRTIELAFDLLALPGTANA